MEYCSTKGKRRRAEQQVISSTSNQTICNSSSRDMISLEASTTSNTPIATTSYDDSDDELGAEIYRTSETAKRIREEQNQTTILSTQTATTRRKSPRLKSNKSREDEEKESICSKPTSTANKNTKRRVSCFNKRKAAVVSADDEICR